MIHLSFLLPLADDAALISWAILRKLVVALTISSPLSFIWSVFSWFSFIYVRFFCMRLFVSLIASWSRGLASNWLSMSCPWVGLLSTDLFWDVAFPNCWKSALLLTGLPLLSCSYFSMLSAMVCTRLNMVFLGYLTSACIAWILSSSYKSDLTPNMDSSGAFASWSSSMTSNCLSLKPMN